MKKKNIPFEFVYQLFALIIAIIIVHAFYVSVVRPNAAQIIEEQNAAAAADPDYIRERRVSVLIKDLEQEACFILGLWALAIMGFKASMTMRERRLLDVDLVPVAEGMRILPEDTRDFARQIEQLPEESQNLLLPRALLSALFLVCAMCAPRRCASDSRWGSRQSVPKAEMQPRILLRSAMLSRAPYTIFLGSDTLSLCKDKRRMFSLV